MTDKAHVSKSKTTYAASLRLVLWRRPSDIEPDWGRNTNWNQIDERKTKEKTKIAGKQRTKFTVEISLGQELLACQLAFAKRFMLTEWQRQIVVWRFLPCSLVTNEKEDEEERQYRLWNNLDSCRSLFSCSFWTFLLCGKDNDDSIWNIWQIDWPKLFDLPHFVRHAVQTVNCERKNRKCSVKWFCRQNCHWTFARARVPLR